MDGPTRSGRPVRAAVCLALALLAPAAARSAAAQNAPPPPITVGGITIYGFVQADAIVTPGDGDDNGSEPPDTFGIPRARIGASGALTPKITWNLQGDFAHVTSDGRVLRDAWLQFTASPQFAVRFGQLVAPFSLERLTSHSKLEVIERSVIASAMTPSRDVGLVVSNVAPWRGWLTYAAGVINGAGQNRADDNDAKDVVGRVTTRVPRLRHLTVGVNAQRGEQPRGTLSRIGVDVNVETRACRIAVEGVSQRRAYETTIDSAGFSVIGAYKRPARSPRPHYAGYELAARYVDVDDDALLLESRHLQAGGTYWVTPQIKVLSNLVVPIGRDQPRHAVRWWSRLQFNF